ncbi:hypothetical protein BDQ17DRAFT_1437285 [Cyathus striatus]|nr:hypothetical protein BDQ17DRAFT_1437285 [Cyathus striatus]
MTAGLRVEDIQVTTSLPKLQDVSVAGLVKAYNFLKSLDGHDLIKMAWRKSSVKEWCLSTECLSSQATQEALSEYLAKDFTLHNEIQAQLGTVQGLESLVPSGEAEVDHFAYDDSDVPLHAVIQDTIGCTLGEHANQASFVIAQITYRDDDSLDLMVAGMDEDIWQFDNCGTRWLDSGTLPTEDVDNE